MSFGNGGNPKDDLLGASSSVGMTPRETNSINKRPKLSPLQNLLQLKLEILRREKVLKVVRRRLKFRSFFGLFFLIKQD